MNTRKLLWVSAVAGVTAFVALGAGAHELDGVVMTGDADRAKCLYKPGEKMTFTFGFKAVEEGKSLPVAPTNSYYLLIIRTGDDGKRESIRLPVTDFATQIVYSTSLDRPGFVSVKPQLFATKGDKAVRPIVWNHATWTAADCGAGVEIEKLRSSPEPADFDDFWTRQKARLAAVPVKATLTPVGSNGWVTVYEAVVDCAGPRPCTGYLSVPNDAAKGKRYPARVIFNSYGPPPKKAPKPQGAGGVARDRIEFRINAHGYLFGQPDAYYQALNDEISDKGSHNYAFVKEEDPEKLYFNGMALRVLRSLEYVKTLPAFNGELSVNGGSQGGLQCAWAASLDHDVKFVDTCVTWCCDFGGFKQGRKVTRWRIPYTPALEYYDSALHAKRYAKDCRVDITRAGLGDYISPPSGLAVYYNNIPGPKSIRWVQNAEHGDGVQPWRQTFTIENPGK